MYILIRLLFSEQLMALESHLQMTACVWIKTNALQREMYRIVKHGKDRMSYLHKLLIEF